LFKSPKEPSLILPPESTFQLRSSTGNRSLVPTKTNPLETRILILERQIEDLEADLEKHKQITVKLAKFLDSLGTFVVDTQHKKTS